MRSIQIKAPAKINVGLNIIRKREDGYHDLETFFYPINDLYDELFFEKADRYSFECTNAELSENNLVIKAKELLQVVSERELNVDIKLVKNIPVGAGLGGGSSDAAATLISLNEMFNLNIKHDRLVELALQLGSDVPFFLKAKPAIGKSRGENLTITNLVLPYYILLVNPRIHISTKEAFNNITPIESNINYGEVFSSFEKFLFYKDKIRNDFETFVFQKYPEIQQLKNTMLEGNAVFSMMSGSGSTVYGFYENYVDASSVEKNIPEHYLRKISSPE